jgi:hypothetical protein
MVKVAGIESDTTPQDELKMKRHANDDRKALLQRESKKFFVTVKDGQTIIERPTAVIDRVETLPNGRGKTITITHKHILPKSKINKKRNPNRLCMSHLKANPFPVSLTVYRNKHHKVGTHLEVYLFAGIEKLRLSSEQFDDLLASMLAIRKMRRRILLETKGCTKGDYLLGNTPLRLKYITTTKTINSKERGLVLLFNSKCKRIFDHYLKTKKTKGAKKSMSEEAIEARIINEEEIRQDLFEKTEAKAQAKKRAGVGGNGAS